MRRSPLLRSISQLIQKSEVHNTELLLKKEVPTSGKKIVAVQLEAGQILRRNDFHSNKGFTKKPVEGSVQEKIINALSLGDRSMASRLLLDISRKDDVLRADDFLDILRYCKSSPDPLFVMETWKTMQLKEVGITISCYILIIGALCKGGYIEEAFNLVNILEERSDIYPVLPMYNNLLKACVKMKSVSHANKCLDMMEKQMVGKNEATYMELLKFAVLQQNLSAAHDIWRECCKYYNPSITVLKQFIWSFRKLQDLSAAYTVLQHMLALLLHGDLSFKTDAKGSLYTRRLDIPIPSYNISNSETGSTYSESSAPSVDEHFNNVGTLASEDMNISTFDIKSWEVGNAETNMLNISVSAPVLQILRWSFNDVIYACAQAKNIALVEHMILQMQNLGVEPSSMTYDGFMKVLVKFKGSRAGIELLKLMLNKNVRPRDSTYAAISMAFSRELEPDLAEYFLDQMSNCRVTHPYNYCLEACNILDQPERAIRILAKMLDEKLRPDIRTYELMFSLFGYVNAPYESGNKLSRVDAATRISAIEADMLKSGIQHSFLSIRNLLRALGAEKMLKELVLYLRVAEGQFYLYPNELRTPIYNTVLHSFVEAEETKLAVETFRTMLAYGFNPDPATFTIMMDCCSISGGFKYACAVVSLMIRHGFLPEVSTYTALIKILLETENLKNRDFDGALHLLDMACSEEMQLDVLLFNIILRQACYWEMLSVTELVVQRMHEKKIPPDPTTCRYVFETYVARRFINTAVEALQVLSMRMILEDDSSVDKIRSAFEDLILAEDVEAESQIIDLFIDGRDNLAFGLLNLRWCAIIGGGDTIPWSPDQSWWAKRLSATYGSESPGSIILNNRLSDTYDAIKTEKLRLKPLLDCPLP